MTIEERLEFLQQSTESLHHACQELHAIAQLQERRLKRSEQIQTALLRGAGEFLKALEEGDNGE